MIPDPANWIVDISQVAYRHATNAYFSVHPNPFEDQLKIIFNTGAAQREILLTDINGRLVDRVNTYSWTVSIPTHNLSPGVYLLRVLSGQEEYTAKVVRQ